MKQFLKDEWVILTGASSGIGKDLALLLLKKYGAKVIGVGRNEGKMLAFLEEVGDEYKSNFLYRLFDVGQKEGWLSLKAV